MDRFVRFRDAKTGALLGVESDTVWDRAKRQALSEHMRNADVHKTQRQIEETASDVAAAVFDAKKEEISVDLESLKASIREAQAQISALEGNVSVLAQTLEALSKVVPRLAERIGADGSILEEPEGSEQPDPGEAGEGE